MFTHKLAEATIRHWVGEESFHRGERYFHDGMIVHARRSRELLKADSHGSSGNLYRVQAILEGGKIIAADCSRPVGDSGHCKHGAALLLTWLHQPEDFREVEDTDTLV